MDETQQEEGQILTVTYRIGLDVSNDQARELIQSSTPSGFDVKNVELGEPQDSPS